MFFNFALSLVICAALAAVGLFFIRVALAIGEVMVATVDTSRKMTVGSAALAAGFLTAFIGTLALGLSLPIIGAIEVVQRASEVPHLPKVIAGLAIGVVMLAILVTMVIWKTNKAAHNPKASSAPPMPKSLIMTFMIPAKANPVELRKSIERIPGKVEAASWSFQPGSTKAGTMSFGSITLILPPEESRSRFAQEIRGKVTRRGGQIFTITQN